MLDSRHTGRQGRLGAVLLGGFFQRLLHKCAFRSLTCSHATNRKPINGFLWKLGRGWGLQ